MKMPRFTVRRLMVVVAVVSVCCGIEASIRRREQIRRSVEYHNSKLGIESRCA